MQGQRFIALTGRIHALRYESSGGYKKAARTSLLTSHFRQNATAAGCGSRFRRSRRYFSSNRSAWTSVSPTFSVALLGIAPHDVAGLQFDVGGLAQRRGELHLAVTEAVDEIVRMRMHR